MMVYSIFYMMAYENMSWLSNDLIYFITMALVSVLFGCMCGAISVLSSYFFVEKIFLVSSGQGSFKW